MRIAMTALAVVILAQAAPAAADAAQRDGREWSGDRPQRDGGGGRPPARNDDRGDPGRSAEPTPAAPAAQAAPTDRPGYGYRGRNVVQDRPRDDNRRRSDGDRRDGDQRDRYNGDRYSGDRPDGDRGRGGDDRRTWDRDRHDDRRDWDRNRYDSDRRDWDRDRYRNAPRNWDRWDRGRYPTVYFSPHRYRHAWRPPPGFYVRIWSYGDFLPRDWYGPSWWLVDPWAYGLPLPPPGYDWVRAGDDALLVDQYTGRIVQVVRGVFW